RTAARRALAPASSAWMRAAAPAALSGGAFSPAPFSPGGGQHVGMTPPVRALMGLRPLLISCPSGQLQNLSFQACSWSGDGQRKDHRLAGAGAAAGAAAVAAAGAPAAGAPGTWAHAPEASPPSSATLALYRFHNFMVWFPLLVREPRGGPDAPAVVWDP